jgi:short-subunit dehydrogenase
MTHVIITGGSSGIGFAVARLYAGRKARISLIARGPAALHAATVALLASGAEALHVEAADVADREALERAISSCQAALGPCDILICSAGIVEPARFEDQPAEVFDRQLAVNLSGSVNAARAVYDGMAARGAGHIVLVSSGAGLIGIPGYAAYCASKYALRGFAEALRFEALPKGVHVSICFPPDTQTPQLDRERAARPPEAEVIMGQVKPWSADAVAAKLVKAIDARRFEVYFGLTLLALGRFGSLVRPVLSGHFDRSIRRRYRR